MKFKQFILLLTTVTLLSISCSSGGSDSSINQVATENFAKLESSSECNDCDLQKIDFQSKSFRDVKLKDADLSNANLSGVDFTGADLTRAVLKNVNLRNAILDRADLTNADLSFSDLTGISFKDTIFTGSELQGVTLSAGVNIQP